jgi:hypothetical protein
MALAILDLVGLDGRSARFRIDTGTNRYFQLKVGRSVGSRSGLEWIDDVVFATPIKLNARGGGLLDTSAEISVPGARLGRDAPYAQLFSFKTQDGRSPAFSPVVRVDHAVSALGPDYAAPESAETQEIMNATLAPFETPRTTECRTCAEQFGGPALGDLLTQIVQVAAPVVMQLLGQGTAAGPPAAGGAGAQPNMLAGLLDAILKAIGAPAAGAKAQPLAGQKSLPNRFANGSEPPLSEPFVFGIDDALIGAAIGQFVQVLPQLVNAANQVRIQMRQSHNKLVGDVVSDVQRRMLIERVQEAQRQAPAAQAPDLAKLLELLQQAGPPAGNGAAAVAPTPVTPQSLSWEESAAASVSSRAVAAFVTAPPVRWNGADRVLFPVGQPLQIKVKLAVTAPVPTTPLPKAIVRVVFKSPSDHSVLVEKVVKQKDLLAGGVVSVPFTAAELAPIPAGKPVSLLAEIRWLSSGGEHKALGATEIALVGRYFVKERGAAIGPERELTDMNRFRPFWNKVWQSPTLDAASGSDRKLLWDLDANLKYTVLIARDHPSNGLMETKFLVAAPDADSVSARTAGRMKGGIELSLAELSKLAPLWDGEAVLDAERLKAFDTPEFAKANASDLVFRLKLNGKAAERGLVWVVPVFRLVDFTLGSVQSTDDSGQVTAVAEEHVHLALPVAARVLGLKTGDADAPAEGEPAYTFVGFKADVSEKVMLTLAAAAAAAPEAHRRHG